MLKSKNILFLISGSIACYKVCSLISKLKQAGHEIKVVLTKSSLNFIGASTIEGLTGHAPYIDMYAQGQAMAHIDLQRWADLIIAAPATANFINRAAAGIADDFATTIFLAHDFQKPFLIAPAMNTKMYQHPTTQKSIQLLNNMGVHVLETASGVLACGETGFGRLLEPELLLNEINHHLNSNRISTIKNLPEKHVLITAGGTIEPIDDVRCLTNRSTGKTAATIANHLVAAGFNVTYLHSKTALLPTASCKMESFESFQDLNSQLTNLLQKNIFDAVIHAAAVSDYSIDKFDGKLDSSQNDLTLKLKKNPKLIEFIKHFNPTTKLFGFKLTSTDDSDYINQKIISLFEKSNCDFVIHNSWKNIKNNQHLFDFFNKNITLSPSKNMNLTDLCIKIAQSINCNQKETL